MPLRDTLLRVAEKGFCQIHFSREILDETTRNLIKKGRMNNAQALRLQSFITEAFPEALVEVPDNLVAAMSNDPKDRHVLAAAVVSRSDIIVTTNLTDFQPEALAPWGVEAQHPDAFLMDLCDLHGTEQLTQVIQEQVEDLHRRPITLLDLLDKLQVQVPKFAQQVTTSLYGSEVRDIARKCINIVGKPVNASCRSYSGDYYTLCLTNGVLTVIATDGRGEILKSQARHLTGKLSPEDVRRFEKIKEAIK